MMKTKEDNEQIMQI